MERDDRQLIADHLKGDKTALPELVSRYLKPIYNFTLRLTGSAQDAEEIAQEAFIKAWRNLKKYRSGESFKAWLFAIARNTAVDWLRKKKDFVFSDFENEEGENSLADTLADPGPLPDEMLARAEEKQILDDLIGELSPAHREVLLLHYNEHLTFDEIGKILGKPLDTVKSRHRRALFALRKLLDAPK